jgi:hypothetical protein
MKDSDMKQNLVGEGLTWEWEGEWKGQRGWIWWVYFIYLHKKEHYHMALPVQLI